MTPDAARDNRRARRRAVLTRLGGAVLRVLARTWRVRWVNRDPVEAVHAAGGAVIYVLWHGQLLPLLWYMRDQGITILISEHGDGEIVARAALSLGHQTARGSTSRGGSRAILEVSRVVQAGGDAAVTPDGPRGPAGSFAPGALIVSQRTGAPIVPIAASATRAWRLRSWDAFLIPKPFARVTVAFGDPVVADAPSARDAAALAPRFTALLDDTCAAASRG